MKLVCAEFDEFEEALYGVQGRYVLRGRQQRDWRLRVVDLNGVALMSGREGAGTVYNGTGLPGFYNIFLPLSGHESTVVDGTCFNQRKIGWMAPDVMFHIDATRPASWLTVAMSNETVVRWVQTHADEFDWSLLRKNVVSCVSISISPLIALARRLFHIDSCSAHDLHAHSCEAAARVELIDAVFRTLLPIRAANDSTRRYLDRKRILRRALELLETMERNTVYVEDICAAAGASERTIRNVFNEYLGMSPHRYLMVRRLHAIRDAISQAAPGETVTSICSRFGVWDFGRLANQYHDYFGHYPSQRLYKRVQIDD